MKAIETRQLTKYYGKIRGIADVNLEVEEGDIFGFIGPNGAGKTTTIRTLLNLIFPSEGTARILAWDIIEDSKKIRQNTGYVPAEVYYYGDMTIAELLAYSASFYPHLNPKVCRTRINELAERFEVNQKRRIDGLSSGNKKKVAIIQALLHNPSLLILDEPTSGLDPLMQHTFFEVLKEENQRSTIFFSSHDLGEVQKMCNKVAIIKQGKIIKVESVDRLRSQQFKTITVEFKDKNASLEIEGVIKREATGTQHKILFNGDIKKLLYTLSQQDIQNISIEEPSLEEIFMHYYEKEEN